MVLQAILFDRFKWSTQDAKQWLKEHSFLPIKKVHITNKFKRFRIAEPDYKKYKYRISHGDNGVSFIIGVLPDPFDD
jgi:hypothetical protein